MSKCNFQPYSKKLLVLLPISKTDNKFTFLISHETKLLKYVINSFKDLFFVIQKKVNGNKAVSRQ